MSTEKFIEEGLRLHKVGQIARAKTLYRLALQENINDPDANNLIANIYKGEGDFARALYHSNIAIDQRRHTAFFNTRGMIFTAIGKYIEAIADLNVAVKLDPTNAEAFNNLSIALKEVGNYKKSLDSAKKAIELRENFPEAYVSLGVAKQCQKDFEGALKSFDRALQLSPDFLPAVANKAKLLYRCERFSEAKPLFLNLIDRISLAPDINLPYAHILISEGEISQATDLVVKLFSDQVDLGCAGSLFEDEIIFSVIFHVCNYLSDVLNQKDLAISIYRKIQPLSPKKDALIDINISKIQFEGNHIDAAILSIQKSLSSPAADKISKITSLNNLGVFYMARGESIKAIESFESVYEIDNENAVALGWLLKEKSAICDWRNYKRYRGELDSLRLNGCTTAISGFTPLAIYNDPEALLYWARLAARDMFGDYVLPKTKSFFHNEKKIKIGFYSYDFRNHPVAHLTARLLELIDRSKFEIFAYSYGPDDQSPVRKRIADAVDQFVDVRELANIDISNRVKADEIDILIDLTGNTLNTRSQVLKYRPSKIQLHWLGFIGTMGTNYYDYIIADDYLVRNGEERYFAEKVIKLEGGFHVTDDVRKVVDDQTSKSQHGLPEGAFVFGCFCQTFKIQPEMFDSWLSILKRTENSVLWIASGPAGAIDNLKSYTMTNGVDPSRIIVAERCDLETYMKRLTKIDLFLDTFPYTSGTLASDALLAGCPMLTMSGNTMVSRMAGSILTNEGLDFLVTSTPEQYIAKAVELAQNPEAYKEVKTKVLLSRNNRIGLDSKKFAKKFAEMLESLVRSS